MISNTIRRIAHVLAIEESDLAAILKEMAFSLGSAGRYPEMSVLREAAEKLQSLVERKNP